MECTRYATLECSNPFGKSGHRVRDKKKLRNVTDWMLEKFDDLSKETKICDSCRKKLSIKNNEEVNETCAENCAMDENFASTSQIIGTLNTSLHELGESPVNKRKVKSKHYASTKIQKISSAMKQKLFTNIQESSDDEDEILNVCFWTT